MGDIEYRILGSVEVLCDGSPTPIGAPRQRAVLAAMLLEANRVVPVGRLMTQLWGPFPPRQARRTVQSLIHRLRKALPVPGGVLMTRPPGYRLEVTSGELDLARFDTLAAGGRDALQRGRPDLAAAAFSRALALWRGDPFADAAGIGLHEVDAPRLLERRLQVVEDRVDADLALCRHGDLIAELPALIAAHPMRERLYGQLMLALYRAGRQAEALDTFQQLRHRLVGELAVEPGNALQCLHRRILAHEPSLEPGFALAH